LGTYKAKHENVIDMQHGLGKRPMGKWGIYHDRKENKPKKKSKGFCHRSRI